MNADILFYYSKSADVSAGSGKGEIIKDKSKYELLNTLRSEEGLGWRRVLSNLFDELPFQYTSCTDGKRYTYRSFEHAFQSEKFRVNGYSKVAYNFTLESGSDLAMGSGLTARCARKIILLNQEELNRWDNIQHDVIISIYKEIYLREGLQRDILLATKDAQLWHREPRMPPHRVQLLEYIRSLL